MSLAGPGHNGTLRRAREEAEKRRPRLGQLDTQLSPSSPATWNKKANYSPTTRPSPNRAATSTSGT